MSFGLNESPVRPRDRGLATLAGALCGASVWASAGQLATDTHTGVLQLIGLLPSLAWLVAAVAIGVAVAIWATSRGVPVALFLVPAIGALPWTPWISSPAIVAWAGPAALLPLSFVIIGVLRTCASQSRLLTPIADSTWSPLIVSAITAMGLGTLLFAATPLAVTGDEPHYLLATQSLLTDGDFDLANNYDLGTYRSFYAGLLEPRHVALGVLGQQYSFHGPALSVLLLPGFAIAGVLGARVSLLLIVAAGAGFFWAAARRLTGSSAAAWIGWIALIVSAPFALHGVLLYPDGVGAAVTCIAMWTLVVLANGSAPSTFAPIVSSIALALLPWLHIRLSLTAGVLGLATLWTLWHRRQRDLILPFMAVPTISLVLWIASTWVMFGTTDPTAIFRQKAAGTLSQMPVGVLGLLFDAEYGLFVYAPIMAVATLGIAATWKRAPTIALTSVALAALTLGIAASWIWWGGDSAPARFLVPVLPLVALWLGTWWTRAPMGARAFASIVIIVTAWLTMFLTLAEHGAWIVNTPDGEGTIFAWLSPNVDLSLALPSLFRAGATLREEAIVAALWTVIGLAAFIAARWATWLTASVAVLVWLTVGASVGWWRHGVAPWTPDRAQLQLLYAAKSPELTIGLRGSTLVSRKKALSTLAISTPTGERTLLHVPFVPAGRYAIEVQQPPSTIGQPPPRLSLELGRRALPFSTWFATSVGVVETFSLAIPTWSVRVVSDSPQDPRRIVRLRPIDVASPPPLIAGYALRATRTNGLMIYSLDDYGVMESSWLRLDAGRQTSIVVTDTEGGQVPFVMQVEGRAMLTIERGDFVRTASGLSGTHERISIPKDGGPLRALHLSATTGPAAGTDLPQLPLPPATAFVRLFAEP